MHQLAMFAETIVFWILVARRVRKWRQLSFAEEALWGWLVLSLGIVLLPGRFHPHYMIQLFAPLAVIAGIEFAERIDTARETKRWAFVGWCSGLLATLAVVFAVIAALWEPFAPAYFSKQPPRYLEVARYIRETTKPSERVFVWGAYTPIYVMSDRLPATRFVAFKRGCGRHEKSPFDDCWDSGPEMWPLLAQDLATSAPALVIDTAPANLGDFKYYPIQQFPMLRNLLATHYSKERTINGVDIYRRVVN
jgi:multisubunit Na+/H+ antiporter MnhB subunit